MAVTPTRWHRRLAAVVAAACACAAVNSGAGAALARTPDKPHGKAHLTTPQRAVLLDATQRFRDVKRALRAGYLPTKDCVPGMGFHYMNPALVANANIDPTQPEALVYAPTAGGSVRLVALEYFRADNDGNVRTDPDRPTLFGHPFDGPMAGHPLPAGHPPMPLHYDLHVWLYQLNPDGELTSENPGIGCR
ncbi:hypothetical protein [Actinoplanes sp. NPDC026623]|jgi:hypothetical protein|uniref:hypothetical protein n=1 Tax=Actinoplanes sp. NPDC026623 TaxID=3155610 RepID=UPI0033D87CAE